MKIDKVRKSRKGGEIIAPPDSYGLFHLLVLAKYTSLGADPVQADKHPLATTEISVC